MGRTKQTMRKHTGGMAPRKQLATTAARQLSRRENEKAFDVMRAKHMEVMREAKEEPPLVSQEEPLVSQEDKESELEKHLEANDQEREELDEVMHLVRDYKDEAWPNQHPSLQESGMALWDKIAELVEERRAAIAKAEQEWTK